ncbi:MAG: oligosaccharide flippase family protein [Muribaculaceae bacterium]|nr:oligosaccharide flippase family protein [Muribaculaceae bacterium]
MDKEMTRRPSLGARVVKAIGVFSSVEFIKLLCAVIRTKLVAVLIGAAGVGVISLYNSTLELLRSVVMLNLGQSAVREVSAAGDLHRAAVAREVGRTALWLGLFAALVTACLSPLLSILAFGSTTHIWAFCLLSLSLLAGAVTDARSAVLQSFGELRALARATLAGVVSGTILAIPTYIIWRMDAIVPVILIYAATSLFFILRPHVERPAQTLPSAEVRALRRRLLGLGAWLTVGAAMGFAALYILRIWLNSTAGMDVVGRFQAGFTVVNSYVGVIFVAIALEFYPRLAGVIRSRRATAVMVSHEIAIALWILIPIIPLFLCCQHLVVRILYSSEFDIITQFLTFAIGGSILRAVSWCYSYVILARADGRIYLLTEGTSAVALVIFGMLGWTYGGYYGLGVAYFGQFAAFTVATALVFRRRYGMRLSPDVHRLVWMSMAVVFISVALTLWLGWLGVAVLVPFAAWASFRHLRRLIRK